MECYSSRCIWQCFVEKDKKSKLIKQCPLYFQFFNNNGKLKDYGWIKGNQPEVKALERIQSKSGHLRFYTPNSPSPRSANIILEFLKDKPKITMDIYFCTIYGMLINDVTTWSTPTVIKTIEKLKELENHRKIKQIKTMGHKEMKFIAEILCQKWNSTKKLKSNIWNMDTFGIEEYSSIWRAIKTDSLHKLWRRICNQIYDSPFNDKLKSFEICDVFASGKENHVIYEYKNNTSPVESGWIKDIDNNNVILSKLTWTNNMHLVMYCVNTPSSKVVSDITKFLKKNSTVTMEIYFAHIKNYKITDTLQWEQIKNQDHFKKLTDNKQIVKFIPFGEKEWKIIYKKLGQKYVTRQKQIVPTADDSTNAVSAVAPTTTLSHSYAEHLTLSELWEYYQRKSFPFGGETYVLYYEFTSELNDMYATWIRHYTSCRDVEELLKYLTDKKGYVKCYFSRSPCIKCAGNIKHFLQTNQIKMEIYFSNISKFNINDHLTWQNAETLSSFDAINTLSLCEKIVVVKVFERPEWEHLSLVKICFRFNTTNNPNNNWDWRATEDAEYVEACKAFQENKVQELILKIDLELAIMKPEDFEKNKQNIFDSFQKRNCFDEVKDNFYIYYELIVQYSVVESGWAKNIINLHAEMAILLNVQHKHGRLRFYSLASPCYLCVDQIINFVNKNKNIKLEIYFSMLSNFQITKPDTWSTATSVQTCKKAKELALSTNIVAMNIFGSKQWSVIKQQLGKDLKWDANEPGDKEYLEMWLAVLRNRLEHLKKKLQKPQSINKRDPILLRKRPHRT